VVAVRTKSRKCFMVLVGSVIPKNEDLGFTTSHAMPHLIGRFHYRLLSKFYLFRLRINQFSIRVTLSTRSEI
jgi:hypothetical protein